MKRTHFYFLTKGHIDANDGPHLDIIDTRSYMSKPASISSALSYLSDDFRVSCCS